MEKHDMSVVLLASKLSKAAYGLSRDVNETLISDRFTDAQVLVGTVDLVQDQSGTRTAFVSFRGSSSIRDWGANSRVWLIPSALGRGAKVHSGFALQWESVKSRVFEELKFVSPARIIVTGHSLGGACAMVASPDIAQYFPGVIVDVITFGAPRCGNGAYSNAVAAIVKSVVRVVHDNDIVPCIPSSVFGGVWAHPDGEWLQIHCSGDLVWRNSDGWFGGLWSRFRRLELGIADHILQTYIQHIEKAVATAKFRMLTYQDNN